MKNFTADMEVIAMSLLKEVNLMEEIKDEVDSYSDDSLYNITSFGTDLSFREIVTMYKEGDLEKPELQRKYVWTKNEASRFVDSILLGLPVPSIFLAKNKEGKRLIVDGYQRIMTIYDYMEGILVEIIRYLNYLIQKTSISVGEEKHIANLRMSKGE